MRVGFTGTRHGMTSAQYDRLAELLRGCGATILHHGDCVGADAEAHDLAGLLGLQVVIHPPSDSRLRAFCTGAIYVHPPRPYRVRDRNIITDTALMFAAPQGPEDAHPRSGTWATVRDARRMGRRVIILRQWR